MSNRKWLCVYYPPGFGVGGRRVDGPIIGLSDGTGVDGTGTGAGTDGAAGSVVAPGAGVDGAAGLVSGGLSSGGFFSGLPFFTKIPIGLTPSALFLASTQAIFVAVVQSRLAIDLALCGTSCPSTSSSKRG